jgi:hypothetical protein
MIIASTASHPRPLHKSSPSNTLDGYGYRAHMSPTHHRQLERVPSGNMHSLLMSVTVQAVREICYAYADMYCSLCAIAFYHATRVVCLHNEFMIYTRVESAYRTEERNAGITHLTHVTSLPHEPSQCRAVGHERSLRIQALGYST